MHTCDLSFFLSFFTLFLSGNFDFGPFIGHNLVESGTGMGSSHGSGEGSWTFHRQDTAVSCLIITVLKNFHSFSKAGMISFLCSFCTGQ